MMVDLLLLASSAAVLLSFLFSCVRWNFFAAVVGDGEEAPEEGPPSSTR
jgi:hypothetical protein